MRIAIFGSGEFILTNTIREALERADFFISADGGMKHLDDLGIRPDIMMGDWDSIGEYDFKDIPHIDYPTQKDATDSEIAVRYAVDRNPLEIMLFGYTGTRLDHSVNNMMILDIPHKKNIPARIYNEKNIIMLLSGEHSFKKSDYKEFKYFSIIPLNDGISLTLKGFKYESDRKILEYSNYTGLCISNELSNEECTAIIEGGRVLGFFSND